LLTSNAVLREEDAVSKILVAQSPLVSLENLPYVKDIIQRENCFDFVLRVGHDCCAFFQTMATVWKSTGIRGTERIVVLLQDNALRKNCVNCIEDTSTVENLNEIWILKNGKVLRHSRKLSLGGKTLKVCSCKNVFFTFNIKT
jgi:hypothetical protein